MPSQSIAQANLMRAAEHGADFPMAKKVQSSMSHDQMHDFSVTPDAGLPTHVFKGDSKDIVGLNKKSFKAKGQSEEQATKSAIKASNHPHSNLGQFLHPAKSK